MRLSCGHSISTTASTSDTCERCNRRQLPTSAQPARTTPTFNAASTPPALLNDHHTTAWAELVVTAGSVEFFETSTGFHQTATPSHTVTIVPDRKHHIAPSSDAEFHVQFFTL